MPSEAELIEALYGGLGRLAPGSEASTLRALDIVRRLREPARVLDAGCGTGASAMVLLRETAAKVTAVDITEPFLETLRARAAAAGVRERVETVAASIGKLEFAPGSFDVIWSEGAIYTIGFDAGLRAWRPLLDERGIVACTELTWLTDAPSQRAREFWRVGYPAMRTAEANIAGAVGAGYRCIDYFALPARDWTEEYYGPVARRVEELRERYRTDASMTAMLDETDAEIALYDACGHEYGYVFYVLQRAD